MKDTGRTEKGRTGEDLSGKTEMYMRGNGTEMQAMAKVFTSGGPQAKLIMESGREESDMDKE